MKENKKIQSREVAEENADTNKLARIVRSRIEKLAHDMKGAGDGWYSVWLLEADAIEKVITAFPSLGENPDTKRINWLEKNGGWLGDENLKAKWTISIPAPGRNLSCPTSLRQAIDAALCLSNSASTKPAVTTTEENLVGERQPTKGDAARGD